MSFRYNGINAPDWLVIEEGFRLPSFNISSEYQSSENIDGSQFTRNKKEGIEFKLPLIIRSDVSIKDVDEIMRVIAQFFYTETEEYLEFDFTSRKILCKIDGPYQLKEKLNTLELIELTVKSSRWYYDLNGEPNKDTFIDGQLTTFNSGIKVPVVQYLKIKEDTTFLSINNETTGQVLEFGKEITNPQTQVQRNLGVLNDYAFDIFNRWTNLVEKSSLPIVGSAKGKYMFKDNVMFVDTFGDRLGMNDWFGPAKYRQLDQRVSGNWEFESRIITPPSTKTEKGRKQFILLDELKKPVALIEVRNQSSTNTEIEVIMTLYNENKSKQILYHQTSGWRYKGLVLKLTKIGDRYTGYVGVDFDVESGKRYDVHTNVYTRTFDDYAGDYNRAIVFAHTQDLRAPNNDPMKFNTSYAKVQQLAVESESPYIFSAGDELVVDHEKHLLTVNGESKYYKSIRSDYFDIVQGENIISINPSSVVESGYQTYRERYL